MNVTIVLNVWKQPYSIVYELETMNHLLRVGSQGTRMLIFEKRNFNGYQQHNIMPSGLAGKG